MKSFHLCLVAVMLVFSCVNKANAQYSGSSYTSPYSSPYTAPLSTTNGTETNSGNGGGGGVDGNQGNGKGNTGGNGVPLDTEAWMLMIAGGAFGAWKVLRNYKGKTISMNKKALPIGA
jgi:hypothetical protein